MTPQMTREEAIAFCELNFGGFSGGDFSGAHGYDIPYALYALHEIPEFEKWALDALLDGNGWNATLP